MKLIKCISDFKVDHNKIRNYYYTKCKVSELLIDLLKKEKKEDFVNLALGISNPIGNIRANEHNLGPSILKLNPIENIYDLALQVFTKKLSPNALMKVIYQTNLSYFKVSIGSEMSSMLCPNRYWYCNIRSVWAHLLIKYDGDAAKLNLDIDNVENSPSELNYSTWRKIYPDIGISLNDIYEVTTPLRVKEEIYADENKYLWIDAVCNAMYES
jgi:hypothetical protein